MLRDRDGSSVEATDFVGDASTGRAIWEQIDHGLRVIAKKRSALDVEEAALICQAQRRQIWRHLGKATLFEYLEEIFGYGPQVAHDRVRVANALDEMPELAEELATGEQSYSALRELTRVVTPTTQHAWRDAARGKNLREIEELVSVHQRGDDPSDPPNHDLKPHILRLALTPAQFVRFREVNRVLADEHGGHLADEAAIEILCSLVLDGAAPNDESAGRAKHQVMMTLCEACGLGWQDGAGRRIPVDTTAIARAECDAQRVGSDRKPGRAAQDIAPKVRRFVNRRDHGTCTVLGCRSARNIEIHHIVPRAEGGSHDAENLTQLCGGHHQHHHEGKLEISGLAPKLTFRWTSSRNAAFADPKPHVGRVASSTVDPKPHVGRTTSSMTDSNTDARSPKPHVGRDPSSTVDPKPYVGRSKYTWVTMKTEATQVLVQSGFSKPSARHAVEAALTSAPDDITLEQLLVAALRRT